MVYVFEDCVFYTHLYQLLRHGQEVRLQPKTFAMLAYLLQHRERVVSRQELCEHLWAQQEGHEAALASTIRLARQALGDTGRAQRCIQTLHGQGYRFVAAVTEVPGDIPRTSPAPPLPVPPSAESPTPHAVPSHTSPSTLADSRERKPVTLLSCKLVFKTPTQSGVASVPEQRTQMLYALAQEVMGYYGGTLQPSGETTFLAVFGVPRAQEDHAQRAVLAALMLQRRWEEENARQTSSEARRALLQMGLHTDLVVAGPIDSAAQAVGVVGSATTMAVALQAEATAGCIVCSEATARLIQGLVRLQPVTSLAEPSLPLAIFQVYEERQPRPFLGRRWPGGLSPFVGRAQELALLHDVLRQVESRRGRVVSLVGEPGIGKSRLLYEFQQQVHAQRDAMFVVGRGVSYGHMIPYLPVLNMLRHVCKITPTDDPPTITAKLHRQLQTLDMPLEPHATLLLTLLGLPAASVTAMSPEALRAQTLAALVQMCLHSSRQHPLILLLDDLHWLDPASEACLAALLERIAGTAVLVVGTYRPGYQPSWLDKSYATQIALPRLSGQDSRALLQARLQSLQVTGPVVEQLLRRGDGNAFFLEELARVVAVSPETAASERIPDTIQAVLTARMDRLLPEDKYLMQLAAVAGKEIPRALLEAVTGWSERQLTLALEHLQGAEFLGETTLWPERLYTFQHGLTQEVVYHSLLPPVRQQYHRQVAQALGAHFPTLVTQQPALLAQHYSAAGMYAEAVPYWRQAGEQALARSAYVEAQSHLQQALEALATLPSTPQQAAQELPLQIALGRVFMATQGYAAPEAGKAYARARALCQEMPHSPRLFAVLRGLAAFYSMRADYAAAYELGSQCLRLAEQAHDAALGLRAHLSLGQIHLFQGEYTAAHRHLGYGCAQHDAAAEPARVVRAVQDPIVTCYALDAPTLWLLGLPDQARQRRETALELARALGHPFSLAEALIFSAVVSICVREYAAVRAYTDEALALATTQGFPHWEAHAALYQGWTKVMQGQGQDGLAQMQYGQAIWQSIGSALARPWFLTLQAEVYGQLGDYAVARATLTEALRLVAATGERHYESEMYRLMGMFLWQDPATSSLDSWQAEVEQHMHRALQIARQQHARALELRAVMSLCQLWQQQGKEAEARQLLAACYATIPEGRATADLRMAAALLRSLGE